MQLDLSRTLEYSPTGGRGKLTLSSSHLLCNGLVGNEQDVADGMLYCVIFIVDTRNRMELVLWQIFQTDNAQNQYYSHL